MKKLVTAMTTVLFISSLILPINSMAEEEIQLAAVVGQASSSGALGSHIKRSSNKPVVSESTLTVATMVTIGAAIGGVLMAVKETDGTSNH